MVDHLLRVPKERMLAPLAARLGTRIHPTALTLLAFGVGLAAAACVWHGAYGLGLGAWLLNRTLDGLDGTLARATGRQSDWGGYLDILLDVAIYALLPIALALGAPSPAGYTSLAWLLASFYLNAISWSYLAAVLEKRNRGAASAGELTSVTMPTGLIEGTETVVFFSLFLLFPSSYPLLFWLMGGLVGLTILQRLRWAARALR